MAAKTREWLLDRTGANATGNATHGGQRPLPRGMGWLNTLGPVLVALLVFEALTGVALAMFYSPHPDAAYESTRYIHGLPMGQLVHGLHKYGESAVIVVLGLHLVRAYLQAAYRPPRELVWISGVILLLITMGFGFTGSLLPWDQNAYNATVVRTGYASEVPLIGYISGLMLRGGPEVGALTLTRFYAIHVVLLPALLVPLIIGHVRLSWVKGPAPEAGAAQPSAVVPGYHTQVLRIALAAFGVLVLLNAAAVIWPAELEFKANPSDATYKPRAEWYMMFLLQIVKDWGALPILGKMSWIPVVVIPGIAMTFLMLAPWIDRSEDRRIGKRPVMAAFLVIGSLVILGFSFRGFSQLHPNATPSDSLYGNFTTGGTRAMDEVQVAKGKTAFVACGGCHAAYGDFQGRMGPSLTAYGMKTFLAEVEGHPEAEKMSFLQRYRAYVRGDLRPPNSKMPKYPVEQLSDENLDATAAYISQEPSAVAKAAANKSE